jgi:hypothetical protein
LLSTTAPVVPLLLLEDDMVGVRVGAQYLADDLDRRRLLEQQCFGVLAGGPACLPACL